MWYMKNLMANTFGFEDKLLREDNNVLDENEEYRQKN